MARTQITVTGLAKNAGTSVPAYQAGDATNGMYIANSGINEGKILLQVANGDTVAHTVTVPARKGGESFSASIPAGGEVAIVLFDDMLYEHNGEQFHVDLDSATGVTVVAYKLP